MAMMEDMKIPVLVKAIIDFDLDGKAFHFENRPVSLFGVFGLEWGTLSAEDAFGKKVKARVKLMDSNDMFETEGTILRERTLHANQMGVKFFLDQSAREKLQNQIRKTGYHPESYVRKYPRIPATPFIKTFPLRASGRTMIEGHLVEGPPFLFDIENLSPGGILLKSESRLAHSLIPGDHMHLTVEPRGDFGVQIEVVGRICRLMEELDHRTENVNRYFGVQFIEIDPNNSAALAELLKDIVFRIKNQK